MATFSPLTKRTIPHHNKLSSRQGKAIFKAIPHHWAGTAGGDARLKNPKQQVSANYLIYSNGDIVGQVPEEYRAWTSGSFAADGDAITIEIQNSSGKARGKSDNDSASWKITDAALNSLLKLLADIAQRYGWGSITRARVKYHREFSATACPGGYIWSMRDDIPKQAQALLAGGKTPTKPSPTKPKTKSIWELADEVMAGIHGDGDQRKKSLGKNYDAVQKEVNRRLGLASPGKAIPAKSKTIAQLADEVMAGVHGTGAARKKSLGKNYDAVQKEVNRRLGIKKGSVSSGPNISQLADAVLRGDYGNGSRRKALLGKNYNAVQKEVNRRLGIK